MCAAKSETSADGAQMEELATVSRLSMRILSNSHWAALAWAWRQLTSDFCSSCHKGMHRLRHSGVCRMGKVHRLSGR